MSAFAARVLAAAGEALTERAGPVLLDLVDALTSQLAVTDTASTDTERGWATIFDLDTTPYPAFVGLATGTPVSSALTTDEARELVRGRPSWRRGTPAAMRAAVQALLIGARQVRIDERAGSPWRLTVRVYAAQYPSGDLARLRAAVASQKPVGIVATVLIDAGASYAHMRAEHGPTYAANTATFPTYAAARTHEPEEGTTP